MLYYRIDMDNWTGIKIMDSWAIAGSACLNLVDYAHKPETQKNEDVKKR